MTKRSLASCVTLIAFATAAAPVYGWDNVGHMVVASAAYQQLTPQTKARVDTLLRMNPKLNEWLSWIPTNASKTVKGRMLFMIAATWPDQIKSDPSYTKDGSDDGNRPDGSPDPSANRGYDDLLMHKYWHFIDTPFTRDGTALPPIPTPNAQERIALFRGVLNSNAPDSLKSYDLTWLLHIVGDVHQPLHCATRVSSAEPGGDSGGNRVKLNCSGCPSELHAFWDDLPGTAAVQAAIAPAIKAAKKLPAADPILAAKSDEKDWIAESFQAAQHTVYQPPVMNGIGPFSLTSVYKNAARALARRRIALAGARLANLLNTELK
jgi:hypothetical protein